MITICGRNIRVHGRLLKIAHIEGDKYRFLDRPEPVIEQLRECRPRVDLFTFMQRLPDASPRFPYLMEWDNLAAIPISSFEHWWTNQIRSYPRNRARQAAKRGVEIREVPFDEALVEGIWQVYNECPLRQGVPFRHYGKDFASVYREEATFLDSSVFIGAYFNGELIGFVKLVADETGTQAGLMNIVSMVSHRDKAPTNALVARAVQSCADRGIRYLVYSNFTYGKRLKSGISDFKEKNGFVRFDLPRYYVPLTMAGNVAFRLGLHRKLIDHIPEPLADPLRKVREAWYTHKFREQGVLDR